MDEKTRLKGIGFEAVWERTFERTEVLVDCEDVVTRLLEVEKVLPHSVQKVRLSEEMSLI